MDTTPSSVQGFTAPKPPLPSARKNMERRALADVTNDSPKQLSPSPYPKKSITPHQMMRAEEPEDGEDALRSQVKLMLQKIGGVEKSPMLQRRPHSIAVGGGTPFSASPPPVGPFLAGAAPTPWNTPSSSCCSTGLESPNTSGFPSPPNFPCYRNSVKKADASSPYLAIYVDLGTPPQFRPQSALNDAHRLHQTEEKQMITASPDTKEMIEMGKNEDSDGMRMLYFGDSVLPTHGAGTMMRQSKLSSELEDDDEDGISEWSVMVNVSSPQGDKEAEAEAEAEEEAIPEEAAEAMMMMMRQWDDGHDDDGEEGHDDEQTDNKYYESEVSYGSEAENEGECYDSIEELCRGVKEMAMNGEEGERKGLPMFEGKHIRFIYSSDNEEEVIEEECLSNDNNSNPNNNNENITVLKGLPAPTGQHLRFTDDDLDLGVN